MQVCLDFDVVGSPRAHTNIKQTAIHANGRITMINHRQHASNPNAYPDRTKIKLKYSLVEIPFDLYHLDHLDSHFSAAFIRTKFTQQNHPKNVGNIQTIFCTPLGHSHSYNLIPVLYFV